MLHLQLLGGFRLTLDGQILKVENRRQKALLAYLLLHAPTPQPRKLIATTLWHESGDIQASTNLRVMLSEMRKEWQSLYQYLNDEQQALAWAPSAALTSDVTEFSQLIKAAATTQADVEMQTLLERAVALYQGELFPECYDEWIISERERLHEQFLGALRQLSALYEEQRNYHEAIRCVRRLLRFDSGREEPYRHLMQLYAALEDRPAIERLYRECVQMLRTEFKLAPSPATVELYAQLMRAGAAGEARGAEAKSGETKPTSLLPKSPLVGRNDEWKQLMNRWSQINQHGPHAIVLSGEPGIGKTRLLQELIDTVRRRGATILSTSCTPFDTTSAYLPVIHWLRSAAMSDRLHALEPSLRQELGRLLPCLRNEFPAPFAAEPLPVSWQRTRLHEALTHALLTLKLPLLLTIDNMQWCDADTLTWLYTLLQSDRHLPLLVVAGYGQPHVPVQHPLTTWRLTLQQQQRLTDLHLTALNAGDVQTLAASWVAEPAQLNEEEQARLYRESGGNPLQLLEALRANPHIASPLAENSADSLRLTFALMLAQLPPASTDLSELAALLGFQFTLAQLLQVSGKAEESVLSDLDELIARGILFEKGAERYSFRNRLLHNHLLSGLSAAKRRIWQKRIDNLRIM